jgi:hypothetical protein
MYSNMIWIISLGSVFVFFTIDNHEIILFTFNFLGNTLILFFNMF